MSATLADFRTEGLDPSIAHGRRMGVGIVETFCTAAGVGLLFFGTCGVGKTHLAAVTLRELVTRYGVSGRFWVMRELLEKIRFSYGKSDDASRETEAKMIRQIETVDVLVLDDLGAERATDWAFERIEGIIDKRYNSAKMTICTTNFPNLPPGALVAQRQETLGDRVGARMWSRLQAMCRAVEMSGADQRRRP